MPKIVILTAAYGEGHHAAARGLQSAFAELDVETEIVDIFAMAGGEFYEKTCWAYLELINRVPNVWAAVYSLLDRVPVVSMALPLLTPMQNALGQVLERTNPLAVISVYPTYGYLIERLYAERPRPFGFHTVVTDSISINSVWYRCTSDTFLVPNEATAEVMITAGTPASRVRALGFPVPVTFAQDRPVRTPPGAAVARVLYMVNAGKERAPSIVTRLLDLPGIQLTVTVGRDEALKAAVEHAAAGRPVQVFGWTDCMPELLMTHHVLIGKAGGAAVQEAIAACTPMLITHVVPGQEEGNARLLVEAGCGAICPNADALAEKLQQLFAHGAREWREWEKNITTMSRPEAAREIARFVLDQPTR